MHKKTVVSFFESLLLVLLFFAMLVQCAVYIRLAQNNGEGSLPPFPESEAKLLANNEVSEAERQRNTVVPYFVGALTERGAFGGTYDGVLAYDVFGCFSKVLENAPGGTAKKVVYSDDSKKYDYLKDLYFDSKNCYYVKLCEGMEFSVLCRLISDTYSGMPENPGFVIRDMFLTEGASGEASIIAVDPEGNVLKIYPSKNVPFNNEYLESYNSTEKEEFEFVEISDNITFGKNCYFPSFKYSVDYSTVVSAPFSEYFDMDAEDADLKNLVGIFGMNEDNTRFYKRATDGAMICVEDTTVFEITPDGEFVFSVGENVNNLGVLLGETGGTEYGFREYVQAARKVVSELNGILDEGCGRLSVQDISYSNGECTFYYNYRVNGVPIENDGYFSLELRFGEDSLVYASGKAEVMLHGEKSKTSMPQKTAYVLMEKGKGAVTYFGPEYCFSESVENSRNMHVKWVVKYETLDGGVHE